MTDPVEDRLRDHFADRAAQVTATPDADGFVNRSAGRDRPATALLAGLAVAVVVLAGGGFGTGLAVAGSGTATTPPTASAGPAVGVAPSPSTGSVAGTEVPSGTDATATLTPLFIRTTASGVTIRAYTAPVVSGCAPGTACPPIRVGPTPLPCPSNGMCAEPANPPASTGGGTSGSGAGGTTGSAGSGAPTTGETNAATTTTGTTNTGTAVTGTVSTGPTGSGTGCEALTLELSTDQAVATAQIAVPAPPAGSGTGVSVLGSGSFGVAEGGPAGWVAVEVGTGVSAVHLVAAGGAVVDAMTPSSGLAVLALTGSDPLTGWTVVGLGPSGATVASTPVVQTAGGAPSPGCLVVSPVTPIVTPTTTTTLPVVHPTPETSPLPVPPITSVPVSSRTEVPVDPSIGAG
jgi:hypothetical protein